MPEGPAEKRLTGILAVCLRELMDDLGAEPAWLPEYQPCVELGDVLAASVEFHGDNLHGSMILAGHPHVLARLYPFPTTRQQIDPIDWTSELTNQAVGRFKNRLLAYGLDLSVNLPQNMPAEELRAASKRKLIEIPMSIGIDDMRLDALLELEVGPEFKLADQSVPLPKGPALPEGSVVLFEVDTPR
jgi:chemotaxis protein CheX